MNKLKDDPEVCMVCGAKWEDGKGFVEPHKFPCANECYGWCYTIKESEFTRKPSVQS